MYNKDVVVDNAVQCSICKAPTYIMDNRFQCTENAGHVADLNTGIFSNLNYYPETEEENDPARDVLC